MAVDGLIIPRSYNDYINKTDATAMVQALQLPNVMDAAPAEGSNKPATSGGIYTALAAKANTADMTTALAGKQDTLTFDSAPTTGSSNPVTSGGVFNTLAELGTVIIQSDTVTIPSQGNSIVASTVTVPKGKWIMIGQSDYTFDDSSAAIILQSHVANEVQAQNFNERGFAVFGGGLNGVGFIESDGTTTVYLSGYAAGNYSGSQRFILTLVKIGY